MRHLVAESLAGLQFALIQKKFDGTAFVQEGEAEGERIEGDVIAADVEEPGDAVGGADQGDVSAGFLDLLTHARALVLAGLAGIGDVQPVDRCDRHRRLARPDHIDGVFGKGYQFRTSLVAGLLKAFDFGFDMEIGIEGQTLASGQILTEPFRWRHLDQMGALEQVRIELLFRLDGVTAIDEYDSAVAQHHQRSRRAGKAGQPGQTLARLGDIFVPMLIGQRNDEAVDAGRR